jgi:hypothetical protein
VVNLHQADYRQLEAHKEEGHLARDWLYVATALGWAATTLLVAAFTGLIWKERPASRYQLKRDRMPAAASVQ